MTDTNPDNHFGAAPGINLVKLTNGTDNDTPPGALVPVGSTVTFTYVVTNTGNVPLSGVTVRDDNGTPADPADDFDATFVGGDADADGLLDLDRDLDLHRLADRHRRPVHQPRHRHRHPAAGGGPPVTDTNPDNHFGAVGGHQPGQADQRHGQRRARPASVVPVGSTVTFTYLVTNTGNVPLSGVTVRDDNGTPANPADDFDATFVGGDADADGLLDLDRDLDLHRLADRHRRPVHQPRHRHRHAPPGGGPPVTDTNPDNHFGAAPAHQPRQADQRHRTTTPPPGRSCRSAAR